MFSDEKFVEAVSNRGLKMSAVAKAMCMSLSTLYKKRKGLSEFTRREIVLFKDFLMLNKTEMTAIFLPNNLRKCKNRTEGDKNEQDTFRMRH